MSLIPAFPVIAKPECDGWLFAIHGFDAKNHPMPRFNTMGHLLTARLMTCTPADPKITRYWPCRRCRQAVAMGEVKCTTERGNVFHFPYNSDCKCGNGKGISRSLTGLAAARVLHWYFGPRPFTGDVDKLSRALIRWGWDLQGLPAIEEYLAVIRSFGIKTT